MNPSLVVILLSFICFCSKAEMIRDYFPVPVTLSDTTVCLSTASESTFKAVELRASVPDFNDSQLLSSSSYGITFGTTDNYYLISVTPGNKSGDELFDRRYLQIKFEAHSAGGTTTLYESDIFNKVGLGDAPNSLAVELNYANRTASVYIGNTYLNLLTVQSVKINTAATINLFTIGKVNVDFLVAEQNIAKNNPLQLTRYDVTALKQRFNSSTNNSIEGFWKYLDRDIDTRYCRPGGNYTIAIVHNDRTNQYDIIYIDGAKTNSDSWQPGMLKGHLQPTIFDNHYDLVWYDSMLNRYDKETHASSEKNAILSFSFPLLDSTVRFCRIPDTN